MNQEMSDFSNMANKQDTPKVGVGVVLINWQEKVLLGKRIGSHGAGQWSLPGGHIDIGEDFKTCCVREVEEETGIQIDDVDKLDFWSNIMYEEGLHYITLYFRAIWDEQQVGENREPDKCEEWRWFSLNHLPEKIFGSTREVLDKISLV